MKYIRTKDGVYNEITYKVAKEFVSIIEEEQAKIMSTTKTNFSIINQADTIEELCDEFVAIYDEKPHFHCLERAIQYADDNKVYGAIWTDKGLIYVAKMKGILPNGEIDWELL